MAKCGLQMIFLVDGATDYSEASSMWQGTWLYCDGMYSLMAHNLTKYKIMVVYLNKITVCPLKENIVYGSRGVIQCQT